MTLEEIYLRYREKGAEGDRSRALLGQAHWFASIVEFDPKTGGALPQALSGFLTKLSQIDTAGTIRDRLWRITEHARPSVERLLRTLNESPRREQALLPVHSVRELDANSFIKLSNRPGRNIREKLAGKPYLQAVRRYQSVNLPENRLLKAFLSRLAELLELRCDCLGEEEDDLLPRIHVWFRSDEARAIARWDNLPPNNTLLSHRDYRRVWDAWRWLQSLEDDLGHDYHELELREETLRKWSEDGQIYASGTHRFADMPVHFNYDAFTIRPWVPHRAIKEAVSKIPRSDKSEEVHEPACIDLAILRPRYATSRGASMTLREACLWQQWSKDHESVDIELFDSDAAYLHEDATTIASTDLFFAQKEIPDPLLDRAARAFATKLRAIFKNDNLSWLVPDFVNDFQLEILRRNLNARFPGAEPLPRSVAAVFEQVDYAKVTSGGFPVVVVDATGGRTCVIKLIARFDPELKERLPDTRGYYWERCPSVILSNSCQGEDRQNQRLGYELTTLDSTGQWHAPAGAKPTQFPTPDILKRDPRIGQFAICVNLSRSPVVGGARFLSMQERAGDIPLWLDQIPELSIKVRKEGRYQRFYLVERGGKTVRPIRGKPVQIPIAENFILPAGVTHYRFPLYQGEDVDEIGYSARLESPAFPLKVNVECKMHLTFEYGADEPYKLVFVPLDKSFPFIHATWKRTKEEIITDAPSPEYPMLLSWQDLRRFPDSKSGGTIDLIRKLDETNYNFGKWIATTRETEWNNIRKSIKGWCRFLAISLWRDGRASLNPDSPKAFVDASMNFRCLLTKIQNEDSKLIPDVRFLESCMHKDAPTECVRWVCNQVDGGPIRDPRAIGFALGDVSQEWQKYIFSRLASHPENDAISVFAYAIWREGRFVERFSYPELKALLKSLYRRMVNVAPHSIPKNGRDHKWARRSWTRATAEPLELLLGLLRTRASQDPEIKMLLQPHQRITKQLAEQIDRIEQVVAESNITLFSRVQIDVQKPEGDRTPDLLYALRLYLTGDDGANAIHITSVSDSDDD